MSGTEVIRYTQIGQEDIRFGTGTFEVTLADGRRVTLREVDLASLLIEYGTWTPTLGGTSTYFIQTGLSIKIGKMVMLRGVLSINQIGTGSTSGISGVPTSLKPTGSPYQGSVTWNGANAAYTSLIAEIDNNGLIQFFGTTAAAVTSTFQTPFKNGCIVNFVIMYEAVS